MVVHTASELDQLSELVNSLPFGDDEANESLLVPALVPLRPKAAVASVEGSVFEDFGSREVPRRWLVS